AWVPGSNVRHSLDHPEFNGKLWVVQHGQAGVFMLANSDGARVDRPIFDFLSPMIPLFGPLNDVDCRQGAQEGTRKEYVARLQLRVESINSRSFNAMRSIHIVRELVGREGALRTLN